MLSWSSLEIQSRNHLTLVWCYAVALVTFQKETRTMSPATAVSPKDIPENERLIHLVEVKYSEDTRPSHQLEAAQQQHKNLRDKQLKGKSTVLHTWVGVSTSLTLFIISLNCGWIKQILKTRIRGRPVLYR